MLEIRNITKIYKTKHASDVVALDDVTINFGDRGLIFLLGKSGSGKSTVLNTIGGLDSFDKGEIIINGKSSETFKQKDFDAYRNTYIGFIFQEYNVLPEFTVEKNIGLALELQGKPADQATIESILDQVDLNGYGKRKPNQLSGGQKQRIAIARALVKNPEIIMADEPTGALDSNTGRQVFETLKKLSQEKLVIVVSHDRENAEIYADRIIELKDGRVIADRVKKEVTPKLMGPNVSLVQNNLVHVKGGNLTQQDRVFIDKLVSNVRADIYISASKDINQEIERTAKINENGKSSVLVDTTNADIVRPNGPQNFNLIRGRMRGRDAFKMGASSLKAKKGKLVISIILAIIAMALFGFADTMACFNAGNNMYQSIQASDNKVFALKKVLNTYNYQDERNEDNDEYNYDRDANISAGDLVNLQDSYSNHDFIPVYDFSNSVSLQYYNSGEVNSFYVREYIDNCCVLKNSDYSAFGLNLVSGSYPTTSTEVAITRLQFEAYKKTGYKQRNGDYSYTEVKINQYSDIIGKTVEQYNQSYTITGIVDTHLRQDIMTEILDKNSGYNILSGMNVDPILRYGFHNLLFVGQKPLTHKTCASVKFVAGTKYSSDSWQNYQFFADGNDLISNAYLKKNVTRLSYNQVIAVYRITKDYSDQYRVSALNITGESIADLQNQVKTMFQNASTYSDYFGNAKIEYYKEGSSKYFDLEVVGVCALYDDNMSYNFALHGIYSKNLTMGIASMGEYSYVITMANGNSNDRDLIVECCKYGVKEDRYLIQNEASGFLSNFYSTIKTLAQVFLYVGLFFAAFATLLIMSFIGNSIAYKKKEIGVLRALGATGHDVYRIFTWESLIIAGIILVFSCVLVGVGAFVVNMLLKAKVGLYLSLFSFGIRQVLLLGAVCLVIGLIASWLPTRKISKMKPIDAIQERK